ncbi:NAD(P)/FAD-dependent oxidoreductase [Maribacter sp. HTCC2170]|uniref:NAD(P)/FAD-dependent oxidoreductase n=1 Tax=Maribacter sp. (strain HTCC2170 / KCCM 42371) TaxID=313603 RepID=UPI00006BD44E|nr:FAD-dependent oxidoreductase [Maribacter sp. HTCC2170]EAR02874.1 oxidoreductase [Maribacter sp. HTCC2170]
MNLSYWEYKTWLSNVDFTIVGSGIVGLNCALALKNKFPKAKILILEKGVLPQGASTKNAGFACFGSISEVLSDLDSHAEEEVFQLVLKRWKGIQLLRQNLGDDTLDFQQHGGHELFVDEKSKLYEKCLDNLKKANKLLNPIFGTDAFETQSNRFDFKRIKEKYISNIHEGQIDTGKMMLGLMNLVLSKGITILNTIAVEQFENIGNKVLVKTNAFEFKTSNLFIATNGFAAQLLDEKVLPARAQVLITKPIPNLQIKGTFHLDEGFYYFRNIENRVLFGGGRNLDFQGEETFEHGETQLIQDKLEKMLSETILPNTPFKIERRWSGIMGVGSMKKPIVKQLSNNVFCGVRLGGMGVAIGSQIGDDLANLME